LYCPIRKSEDDTDDENINAKENQNKEIMPLDNYYTSVLALY